MMMRLLSLFVFLSSFQAIAKDKLVILLPHRKSIQQEFVPSFEQYYQKTYGQEIEVEWLDQGGTTDNVRFLRTKYGRNPDGVGMDIFWGGGAATFSELARSGFLAPYELPKELGLQVPESVAGVTLRDQQKLWFASAMSSFGIFYNKRLLQIYKLPAPQTWSDLTDPAYLGNVSLIDPRRSGSANTMNTIIIQAQGWDPGWSLLTRMAANARSFTHSSSDPIKAVVSGDAAIALAIDFYALAKIGDLGAENLGYALPEGQTVLDPDPVAILKGAPNRRAAERFVNYLLQADVQKRLVLPKGKPGGPRFASLGRMAINSETYKATEGQRINAFNPFAQKSSLKIDLDRAVLYQEVFNDLIGALLVDTHRELTDAWKAIVKRKQTNDQEVLAAFTAMPLNEKQFEAMVKNWDDEVFRNKTINEWVAFAKTKYKKFK